MFELVKALNDGARILNTRSSNPISLNAGCELFIAFVTLFPHDSVTFADLKTKLIRQGQQYAKEALGYRQKIAELAVDFIKDGSVVRQTIYPFVIDKNSIFVIGPDPNSFLLKSSHANLVACTSTKANIRFLNFHFHLSSVDELKHLQVFVTEARPRGLGIKTAEALTAAGIPNTVLLDSAVAYVMEKVDFVLVGSEAVVESGGLINAVGSNQIAIIAKAANKPFYALAESHYSIATNSTVVELNPRVEPLGGAHFLRSGAHKDHTRTDITK
ncbi:hypothetical protein H0H93_016081 [Arthromyces matolae]|nr:hypothetical protein H0H93_016081 [Arthromyces matolae]